LFDRKKKGKKVGVRGKQNKQGKTKKSVGARGRLVDRAKAEAGKDASPLTKSEDEKEDFFVT